LDKFFVVYGCDEESSIDTEELKIGFWDFEEAFGISGHELWDELDDRGVSDQFRKDGYSGVLDLGPSSCKYEAAIIGQPPGYTPIETPRFSSWESRKTVEAAN